MREGGEGEKEVQTVWRVKRNVEACVGGMQGMEVGREKLADGGGVGIG